MKRDDRNDTDLYLAIGGEVPFKAMRRAMRARWMKARRVSEAPATKRAPRWLSDAQRFWCLALGIPPVDNQETMQRVGNARLQVPSDHIATFTRDGRVVVFTAQPYFRSTDHIRALEDVWRAAARQYDLTFTSSLSDSWHYPGRTVLFALWLPGEADRA